jgi:AcrR family transcriptional regulator
MPNTDPTTLPATTTKEAILNAAYDLFLENGFHGTSMRQIANRAGLAVAGIYNHFPSKEAVYAAVIEARHPFNTAFPELANAAGETVEEYLRDAARRLVEKLGSEQKFLRLMFIEVVEFNNRHIAAVIERQLPGLLIFVENVYHRRGALRALPPIVFLRSFLGFFFSYFLSEVIIVRAVPGNYPAGAFDDFIDIYLHGVLNSPAKAE